MKITALVALFLSSVSASRFSGDEPISGTSTSNSERLSSNQNDATFSKSFIVSGVVSASKLCLDFDEWCGSTSKGKGSVYSCVAAQKAVATVQAGWAIGATLKTNIVGTDIDRITLSAAGLSSTLAASFASSTTTLGVRAPSIAGVSTLSRAKLATAAASSIATNEITGFSNSKSETNGSAGTTTTASTFVNVNGIRLRQFTGVVVLSVQSFVQSESQSETFSLASAASRAYTSALAEACVAFFGKSSKSCSTDRDDKYTSALVKADEFGQAFSKALLKLVVSVVFEASVTDTGNTLRVSLQPNESRALSVSYSCKA